jgi:hypothetical protein
MVAEQLAKLPGLKACAGSIPVPSANTLERCDNGIRLDSRSSGGKTLGGSSPSRSAKSWRGVVIGSQRHWK